MNDSLQITLQPQQPLQTLTGFGASACWWSPQVSDAATRDDLLRRLYGKDGLALNIYRYNVGGGVNPAHERVTDSWRLTESFLVPDENGGWTYDFSRDANAQAALFKALSFGCVDTVVLFANSPHYSMTVSGESSGHMEAGACNLRKDCFQAFVDYFLTVTEYFLSKGVPVKYISPINEPQWNWGGEVRQEGCHYEPEDVIALLHLFAEGLEARGLHVKLTAPESGEIGERTQEYFSRIADDALLLRHIGSFSYHSYWQDDNPAIKAAFGDWYAAQSYANIPLEMSEWCELPNQHATTDPMAAALMAGVIADDLRESRPNSWTAWVAVNTQAIREDGCDYSDGLFSAAHDFSRYSESYRYSALGHFSKFIPVGAVQIPCTASVAIPATLHLFAALRPDGTCVLVAANCGKAQKVQFPAPFLRRTVYITDETHRLACIGRADSDELLLPACSVATILFTKA